MKLFRWKSCVPLFLLLLAFSFASAGLLPGEALAKYTRHNGGEGDPDDGLDVIGGGGSGGEVTSPEGSYTTNPHDLFYIEFIGLDDSGNPIFFLHFAGENTNPISSLGPQIAQGIRK